MVRSTYGELRKYLREVSMKGRAPERYSIEEIRKLRNEGYTIKGIMRELGLKQSQVTNALYYKYISFRPSPVIPDSIMKHIKE
jgi:hypothetical protein